MKATTMSRRSMLGGLLTAGSLALWPEGLAAAANDGGLDLTGNTTTNTGTNTVMATAAKPGYRYHRCSPSSFVPARTVDYARFGAGIRHTGAVSETFVCAFAPPNGSTIKEVEVYVDTGTAAALFALLKIDDTFHMSLVGPTPVAAGTGIQTITVPVDVPVDPITSSFEIAVGFHNSGALYGARIASVAPTGLISVPQHRKVDTRSGVKPVVGSITTVDLAPDVPAGARAALVTITATDTQGNGFVTAFPGDLAAPPDTSTLNWTSNGIAIANTAVVGLDGGTTIKLAVGGLAGTAAHLLCDVVGYFI